MSSSNLAEEDILFIEATKNNHDFKQISTINNDWEQIGKGKWAKVYLVRVTLNNGEDKQFVIKKILEKEMTSSETPRGVTEAVALYKLQHKYIAQIKGAINIINKGMTYLYIMMDYYDKGTLADLIVNSGRQSHTSVRKVALQMLKALKYIHSEGVIHRDLKPEDVFIVSKNDDDEIKQIKMGDFGLCKIVDGAEVDPKFSAVETHHTEYQAPELEAGKPYTCACDIWSLGAIIYSLLCESPPFTAKNCKELKKNKIENNVKFNIQLIDDNEKKIIKLCLEPDPSKRATVDQLFADPYFRIT